jgi:hypothetical protein
LVPFSSEYLPVSDLNTCNCIKIIVTHRSITRQRPQHTANNRGAVFSVVCTATVTTQSAIPVANNTGVVFSVLRSDPRLHNSSQSERTVSRSTRMRMERVLVIDEVGRLAIAL